MECLLRIPRKSQNNLKQFFYRNHEVLRLLQKTFEAKCLKKIYGALFQARYVLKSLPILMLIALLEQQ